VAVTGEELVGTITLRPCDRTRGSPWLDRPDVASVGQFAVDPAFQRCGIGSRLLRFAEQRAAILGAAELALDTAEPAQNLIDFYAARGYRFIEHLQWPNVTTGAS
jgi:GNAT superfamily N-acetyltransferase